MVEQCGAVPFYVAFFCEIQAGDPFMLFNVQHEAFASASGSFASDTLPEELRKKSEQGTLWPIVCFVWINTRLNRLFRCSCSIKADCPRISEAPANIWRHILAN